MEILNVKLNPNDRSNMNLSNNDLSFIQAATTGAIAVRATHGKSSGKWYWEVYGTRSVGIGVSNKNYPINSTLTVGSSGEVLNMRMVNIQNRRKFPENTSYTDGAELVGQDIGVALDLDNGTLEFFLNGISMGVSHSDLLSLGELYPTFRSLGYLFTSEVTVNFGATPFKFPMPHGFYSYDGRQNSWYDRFLIQTSNNETITIKYDESKIENAIPVMTSNTSPEGEVIYSSYYDTYYPWKAFDKSTTQSDRWATNSSTGYLGYKFSIKKIITSYTIAHATGLANTLTPNTWTFEASNDGTDWIVLDSQHSQIFQSAERRKYTFFNDKEYLLYRINVSKNNGHNYLAIGELEMYEYFPYTYRYIPMVTEQNFINHGMDRSIQLDLSTQFNCKVYIEQNGIILGKGKVFKKLIDTSKKSIKSVKIN